MLSLLLLLLPQADAAPPEAIVRLRVECPPGLELYIDSHRSVEQGLVRHFHTPPLPEGRYSCRVAWRQGGTEVACQQVEFAAGETVRVAYPGPEPVVPANFGLDLRQWRPAAKVSLNGQPISLKEAERLLDGPATTGPDLPSDGQRRRLTLIGPAAARQAVERELAGPLRELAADYLLKSYLPNDWAMRLAGFVTHGSPTIYAQEADGRVLFRQDDGQDLRRNLEAVRAPKRNYQPHLDPDYRRAAPPADEPSVLFPLLCLVMSAVLAGWLVRR